MLADRAMLRASGMRALAIVRDRFALDGEAIGLKTVYDRVRGAV
jgi:hypothetical protein